MKEFRTDTGSTVLRGIGLSPGIVIGTAYRVEPRAASFYRLRISAAEVSQELERLRQALDKSRQQLRQIKDKFEAELGREHSYIIDAHMLMLEDRQFVGGIVEKITQGLASAERAVNEIGERWLGVYRSLNDPFFRERGSDLQEVIERVVSNLTALDSGARAEFTDDLVLVAPEISLAVLATYEVDKVKGLVLSACGQTSHVTIIARSYRTPVVSGIDRVQELIRTGDTVIVDGSEGVVYVNPSPPQLARARTRREEEKERVLSLVPDREPCVTRDGRRVFLHVNTEVGSEVPSGLKLGAEGVGLFRTEYIYMKNKKGVVGEDEQFEIYKSLAQTVKDRPVLIRTLDISDGRHPYFSQLAGEADSVLGLRGVRLSLRFPEIFRSQVRAVLRAGVYGNLKIVLPMVSSVDELLEARALIREAQDDLEASGNACRKEMEVGVMLEVPAAIFALEALAENADFLAVGTNDLIQYTLAAGRSNEGIAYLFDPLHPAILRSLKRVAEVAEKSQRTALICGEIAANPTLACLLVGMGFQHLSMNPYALAGVKAVIREMSYSEAHEATNQLLQLDTLKEVTAFVRERFADVRDDCRPLTAEH